MFTEAEAKTKWCPFVSADDVPPNADGILRPRCIASECMAWRIDHVDSVKTGRRISVQDGNRISLEDEMIPVGYGYCGLACKP